jgi:hypothetical protein
MGGIRQVRESADNYILVIVLLCLAIMLTVLPPSPFTATLQVVVFSTAGLAALHASRVPTRVYWLATGLVALWAVDLALNFPSFSWITLLAVAVLLLVAPVAILVRIARHRTVTIRTIAGAVAVYLQLGLAFAFIYRMALVLNPEALHANFPVTPFTTVYYSFITLTTVGYGDVAPGTDPVRLLAILEPLIGQVYLVVIVARLVSMLGQERGPAVAIAEARARLAAAEAPEPGSGHPEDDPAD